MHCLPSPRAHHHNRRRHTATATATTTGTATATTTAIAATIATIATTTATAIIVTTAPLPPQPTRAAATATVTTAATTTAAAATDAAVAAAVGTKRRRREAGIILGARVSVCQDSSMAVVAAADAVVVFGGHDDDGLAVATADVLDIADLGATRAPPKPRNRSHEHCHRMRATKSIKRLRVSLDSAQERAADLGSSLQLAAVAFLALAGTIVATSSTSPADARVKAAHSERLSMRGPVKDITALGSAQVRAAYLVSSTLRSVMWQTLQDMLYGGAAMGCSRRSVMLCWQHDETKQRLKLQWLAAVPGTRTPHMQASIDVMVGSGAVHVWDDDCVVATEPCLARSLQLMGQSTAFILEGLLRQMPFRVNDAEAMTLLAGHNDDVLLGWGCDRASTNMSVFRWIFDVIHHDVALNVTPHVEPCGCHGVALAKGRASGLKTISEGIHGWSRLNRLAKNFDAIRTAVHARVVSSCRVVEGPPPDDVLARRKALRRTFCHATSRSQLSPPHRPRRHARTPAYQSASIHATSLSVMCVWASVPHCLLFVASVSI